MTESNSESPVIAGYKPCYVELEKGKNYLWCACGRSKNQLCLLFIHPRAPNLIGLRSAGTMPA